MSQRHQEAKVKIQKTEGENLPILFNNHFHVIFYYDYYDDAKRIHIYIHTYREY